MLKRIIFGGVLLASLASSANPMHAQGVHAAVRTVKQVLQQCTVRRSVYHTFPMVVQGYFRSGQASPSRITPFGALFDSNKVPGSAGHFGTYIHYSGLYVTFPSGVKGAPFRNTAHLQVSGSVYCAGIHSSLKAKSVVVLER